MRPDGDGAALRVHVQISTASLPVFHVTPERFEAHFRTPPSRLGALRVSFGSTDQELEQGLSEAEILLAGSFDARDLASRAPRLRWVQSIFAGVERLCPLIPERVTLTNAGGVHAPKAGEFVICALLWLNGRIGEMQGFRSLREWRPIFTPVIAGRRVCILGTGNIGQEIASRCRQFGMAVTGVNRGGQASANFDSVLPVSRLHEALAGAAFLVITVPQTPDTTRLIDAEALEHLADGAGVVNVGRGPVLDEAALAGMLASGKVGGAALDVFEQEPLPAASPLWDMPNVMITAHCAIDDLDAYLERALSIFSDNVERYMSGQQLVNIVETGRGY